MAINGNGTDQHISGVVRSVNDKGLKLDGQTDEKRARVLALKRASYLRHRETEIARKRARYLENREQESARQKARYRENPEPARARAAASRAAADPAAVAASQRAYRERNAERLREQKREYYQQNRARLDAANNAWKLARGEEWRAYMRDYYTEHRERRAAQIAEYKRANPDAVRAWNARRDALKRAAPINDLTRQQWAALKRAYSQRCAYCGVHTNALTMDHVTPLIERGSHTARNIVPACAPCNFRKNRYESLPISVLPTWSTLVPAIWSQS